MESNDNVFFVYEGKILIAAQSKLKNAVKYLKEERQIFRGTPQNPQRNNITNICKKLTFKNSQ